MAALITSYDVTAALIERKPCRGGTPPSAVMYYAPCDFALIMDDFLQILQLTMGLDDKYTHLKNRF